MMNETPMQTTISVLKGMHIDKSKCRDGSLQNGIQFCILHSFVCGDEAPHQWLQVLRTRTDELRQRISVVVAVPQENAVRAKTLLDKSCVLDEDRMKTENFFHSERILSGLQNGASPSFQPTARRLFSFDFKTGATISKQQETCRAHNDAGSSTPDDLVRTIFQRSLDKPRQRIGSANDGTELSCA